ncbi:MAG: hypothetical protein PHV77_03210 [Candidatus Omnitrophica bacterium]|jgi:hypothetical protein|nr:hypothetical protein [Candidatus Omnitrophota bacterium]
MNSTVLAMLIGPFMLVIGLTVLLNQKALWNIRDDLFKSPALLYISGLMIFSAGTAIVAFHNIWAPDWRLIITIFGWLMFAKGVLFVVFPDIAVKIAGSYPKNDKMLILCWIIMLAIGIFLTAKGYYP